VKPNCLKSRHLGSEEQLSRSASLSTAQKSQSCVETDKESKTRIYLGRPVRDQEIYRQGLSSDHRHEGGPWWPMRKISRNESMLLPEMKALMVEANRGLIG
jgi:hypothetical protein